MNEKSSAPYVRYYLDSVEIDNPLNDCKVSIPAFVTYKEPENPYKDMKASSFGLQTLLDAGVRLTPSSVVTTSFLRETEKFMQSVENNKTI